MKWNPNDMWTLKINASQDAFEYKFAVVNPEKIKDKLWEEGENRKMNLKACKIGYDAWKSHPEDHKWINKGRVEGKYQPYIQYDGYICEIKGCPAKMYDIIEKTSCSSSFSEIRYESN